jgi:hypothetical protein
MANIHEDLTRQNKVRHGSPRSFGLVFCAAFTLLGAAPLRTGQPVRSWSLAVAAFFLVIALLRPSLLDQLNKAWLKLGELLARIVNPVVTAILFYLVFTPFGFLLRLFGVQLLARRYDRTASSYWLTRKARTDPGDPLSQQF